MKKATLDQAAKILAILDDTPLEQVQAMLSSGLFADLRDGNLAGVNRNDFRRILGLKPLGEESRNINLVQTKAQADGGTTTLGAMLKAVAILGQREGLYEHVRANPQGVPKEWHGKTIYFPETESDFKPWGHCVQCMRWNGHGWDWDTERVINMVGPNDYVAVPA